MTRILTYNLPLETNMSYPQIFRRLLPYFKSTELFYGSLGVPMPITKLEKYTIVPYTPAQNYMPKEFNDTCSKVKPDAIFVTDDMQRLQWFGQILNMPRIMWIPWDNEDPDLRQAIAMFKHCEIPITVAKFAQQAFIKSGITDMKQIYNPVDIHEYYKDEAAGKAFREKLKIPEDHKLITWVGRPGWRKRFSHIVEIASRIIEKDPTVHLYLHMDFKDPANQFEPQEFLYARDLFNNEKVYYPADLDFKTGAPVDVMRGIYNATDVYIAPHGGEGMGLPIVEAMACETPFVATDYTTTKEFADYPERNSSMIGTRGIGAKMGYLFKDKGIIRPYVDIKDFVDKTLFLLNNDSLRKDMGKKGREFVEKEMSCEVVAKQLEDIFEAVSTVNSERCVF